MRTRLSKVQNFDKTVSTIPTNAVLTESFRNWTGMQISGGRRIKRALLIDMRSIQVCTPEMIERFEQIELIRDYITENA
jgi:miniconductance mechanosensitive channel